MPPVYILGDLHGHYRDYERLLVSEGLCNAQLDWTGGDAQLWLIGDFFDRGASGIRCVDLTMKLQQQAQSTGGRVESILGNHEMMILCAWHFRDAAADPGESVYDQWLRWGGIEADFEGLNQTHVAWLSDLPAMARVDDALLLHADAMLYVNHGFSVDQVNQSFRDIIASRDLDRWLSTLSAFSEHMAFSSLELTGKKRAEQLLSLYGGDLLVHGHTPIPYARQIEAETVTEAWHYADGRCLNVDGGMYMGSPGFLHRLR